VGDQIPNFYTDQSPIGNTFFPKVFDMMQPPSTFWEVPRSNSEIDKAVDKINFDSLCQSAFSLKKMTCTLDKGTYTYGGVNILFELVFDDHEIWIARIRRPDEQYPVSGIDYVLESEVATMRFLHHNTTLPIPAVHGHDARLGAENRVGMPYIFMEAMPGKRLYGSGRADFIPDKFKPKVYRQITAFTLQLYSIPFHNIGMLFVDENTPSGVQVREIHDQHYRISPYGPFTDSYEFYHSRWLLLSQYYAASETPPDPSNIVLDKDVPAALRSLVDRRATAGPFYLAHPDYQISNFLFDEEYTITGLVDWSGCQTFPIESFARLPAMIIPDADKFMDATWGELATPELRSQWATRRELFFGIFKECVMEKKPEGGSLLCDTMLSSRGFFASCLDSDGITGIRQWLPRIEFERFLKEEVDR
jgi:hypothetical protein